MEIVWLRDPTSIPALHTKSLARLTDSLFGTVFNILLGVGSFGCSIFIPLHLLLSSFYDIVYCSFPFITWFVHQTIFLQFMFTFFLRSLSLASFLSFGDLVRQKIMSFGGSSTTVHSFFRLAVLLSPSTPSFSKPFWWIISSPRIGPFYLQNIHSICILQPTAIRHHHHQSQTLSPELVKLYCLRFVINKSYFIMMALW